MTTQHGITVSYDSYVKTEVIGCNRNTLGMGPGKPKTISLDTPSSVQMNTDVRETFTPLWAIRNKSSDYPVMELGLPRVMHIALLDFHSTLPVRSL